MTAAEIAGLTLLHFLWQGGAVALMMQLLLLVAGRSSATVRYGIACAALITMAALPAITSARLAGGALPTRVGAISLPVSPSVETGAASITGVERSSSANLSSYSRQGAVLTAIVWIWAFGVALLAIRTAAGWWRVRRLHKRALRATQSIRLEAVEIWAHRLGLGRAPWVVESGEVGTPAVVGWLRPVVLLPIAALASLTTTQVEAILVHELAHIRRHDYLVNLLQSLVETALFYHPAVWWVSATIRAEREHCCDDMAMRFCGDRHAYADALVALESKRFVFGFAMPAATAGPLTVRVARILQLPPPRSSFRPTPFLAIGLTLALIVVPAVAPDQQVVSGATQTPTGDVDWFLHATDHVEIYYSQRDTAAVAAVARAAEAAYSQVSVALRHDLSLKVPIVLLTGAEMRAAGPSAGFTPIWRASSAPGPQLAQRMILPVDVLAEQPWMLAHEMVHQFLFDMEPDAPSGAAIPVWFHEGLADSVAGVWPADATRIVRAGVISRSFMPSGLENGLRQRTDEDVQHLAHAMIDFIDHEFGDAGMRRFLAVVRSASTSGNVSIFQTAFEMSAVDFDRAFERFIQEQFGR